MSAVHFSFCFSVLWAGCADPQPCTPFWPNRLAAGDGVREPEDLPWGHPYYSESVSQRKDRRSWAGQPSRKASPRRNPLTLKLVENEVDPVATRREAPCLRPLHRPLSLRKTGFSYLSTCYICPRSLGIDLKSFFNKISLVPRLPSSPGFSVSSAQVYHCGRRVLRCCQCPFCALHSLCDRVRFFSSLYLIFLLSL